MRSTVSVVVVACCLVASASAQEKTKVRSTFEPASQPGAGQKLLEAFQGDWDVIKTFYPARGAPVRTKGQCRQRMIHDGRFLQSEFVFEQGGRKTSGLGIIGFEPETETFTSFWTDSRRTQMSVRRSKDHFDGKQIILFSRSLEESGKEARRSRTVSRLDEGGRKLIHRQYALGPAGEERLMMELEMTRKSPTAAGPR